MERERTLWIMMSTGAIVSLPLTFIGGLVVGVKAYSVGDFDAPTIAAWIAAAATVAIAALTCVLAAETWRLRHEQMRQAEALRVEAIKPFVDLFLEPAPVSFQLFNVHVSNGGNGPARNIQFAMSGPDGRPPSAIETEIIDALQGPSMISSGIAALPPGKDRESFVLNFIALTGKFGDAVFGASVLVTISYEDVEARRYSTETVLDLSEYRGIVAVGGDNPLYKLRDEVETIRGILASFQSGGSSSRMNVNLFTARDRKDEDAATRHWIDEVKLQCESTR